MEPLPRALSGDPLPWDRLLQWGIDGLLGLILVGLALAIVTHRDPFRAAVFFVALGLATALVWVRLSAPDIALAEAAIGAGVTGALLLRALQRIDRPLRDSKAPPPPEPNPGRDD